LLLDGLDTLQGTLGPASIWTRAAMESLVELYEASDRSESSAEIRTALAPPG